MSERLYTTQQAAALLGVRPNLIAQWKTAGKIEQADSLRGTSRSRRQPLYRLEELRPHADAYHQRATTRRTKDP